MKIAVLGAGLMGRPMAERLKAAGHAVQVYNRTREKIADLSKAGIDIAKGPEDAVRDAACVILMLADVEAIRDVLLRSPARKELHGRAVIQMGTIGPRESQSIQKEVVAAGGNYLEAPVLGSLAEVRAGKLIVMVGGTSEQLTYWSDMLRCFGPAPRLIGPVGQAAALKLALNQLIAAETAAFALSLGLIERKKVSVDTFMAILRESALFAPTFEKKLPRLLKRDYTNPNFPTKHLLKDVELILQEAKTAGLDTSSLEGLPPLLKKSLAHGSADADYSALYNVVNPTT
jgi:3-hydroxyisobutyrate dehydrogenase